MGNTIRVISDQLARIFRHIIPGILVVGAARIAHPYWFRDLSVDSWPPLLMLAAIAIAVGNVWYVLHRYTVHQLIDLGIFLCCKKKCKNLNKRICCDYTEYIQVSIENAVKAKEKAPELRNHFDLRSSQIILMFITAEILLVFSWRPEPCTLFEQYLCLIRTCGIIIFILALWQYIMCNTMDSRTANKYSKQYNLSDFFTTSPTANL